MKTSLLLLILLFVYNSNRLLGCTNFLFTKSTTKDGSSCITYAADSHVLYGELYHYPAQNWTLGSMVDIYEWDTGKYLGKIPQVAHTYNVIGNMNEYQLAIAETTYGGRQELGMQEGAIIDYGSLIYLTLQRAQNAREAIKIMAELVENYGYYSSGESFSICDPDEVWILEMIGKGQGKKGAVWVARMVPDGYVCAHANQARIRTFPQKGGNSISSDKIDKIKDTKVTTVYAKDVISFAREKGYISKDLKDADFSFADTYAPVDFGAARFCELRVWALFNELADMKQYWEYAAGYDIQKKLNGYVTNSMPLWIKPTHTVDITEIMDFMRNHLEGTPLDMAKDPGAGPFECPYRWRPMEYIVDSVTYIHERTTATQQTGFSFVAQCRNNELPRNLGGILWFGVDDCASTVYFPMFTCATNVPKSFAVGNGSMMEFTNDAAFWVFNQVTNFAYGRYNVIHPDIRELQKELELRYAALIPSVDTEANSIYKNTGKEATVAYLTNFSCQIGDSLTEIWRTFYGNLFAKYMDGNIRIKVEGQKNPKVSNTPLPEWFQREIIRVNGDKQRERKY